MPFPELPFPRGTTASQGVQASAASFAASTTGLLVAGYRPDLKGLRIPVRDTVHKTNREVILMPVQFKAKYTILATEATARLAFDFDTDAGDLGYQLKGTAAADGTVPSVLLDDALPLGTVIEAFDWVYAIVSGPAACVNGISGGASTINLPLMATTGGILINATAGNFHIGTLITASYSAANLAGICLVNDSLQKIIHA